MAKQVSSAVGLSHCYLMASLASGLIEAKCLSYIPKDSLSSHKGIGLHSEVDYMALYETIGSPWCFGFRPSNSVELWML